MFQELQKFLNECGHLYRTKELATQEFMKLYEKNKNDNSIEKKIEEIDNRVDLSIVKRISEVSELERVEKEKWHKGYKLGFRNPEERDYFMLKLYLSELYLDMDMYILAMHQLEEILKMDPIDPLGIRYKLMGLYCRLGHKDKMSHIMKRYDGNSDDMLLVLYLLLHILLREDKEAKRLLKNLVKLNKHVIAMFSDIMDLLDYILDLQDEESYKPNSQESIAIALSEVTDLLNLYVCEWLETEIISFDRADIPKMSKELKMLAEMQRVFSNYSNPIFKGIRWDIITILGQNKLHDLSDFKKVTESKVLSIKGIGAKTIQILKENGVVFKKEKTKK